MAPGLARLIVKREAPAPAEEVEYVDEEPQATTLATHIFGKHLHKVRVTTPTTTTVEEGKFGNHFYSLTTMLALLYLYEIDTNPLEEGEEGTAEPTQGIAQKGLEVGLNVAGAIGEKTGIPTWGVVSIFVLIALVILGICGFCIRRCFRKRRSKDGKKGMKGVDLKSVQLLGSAYKEKVNIIMSMNVWLFDIYENNNLYIKLIV